MQKESETGARKQLDPLESLGVATENLERAQLAQIRAAHNARKSGATWREIASFASKGSAASAASYFGDSMEDRAEKRAAARDRANGV